MRIPSVVPQSDEYKIKANKQVLRSVLIFLAGITVFMVLLRQLELISKYTIVYYLAVVITVWLGIAGFYSCRYHFGRFDLFHPLVYSCWFFYLPTITIGIFQFIDPNVPTSLGYRFSLYDRAGAFEITLYGWMLATFGLVIGYFLPIGHKLGRAVNHLLHFKQPDNLNYFKHIIIFFTFIGMVARIALYYLDSRRTSGLTSDSLFTGIFDLVDRFYVVIVIVAFYYVFRGLRDWKWIAFLYIPIVLFGFLIAGSRQYLVVWVVFPLVFAFQYANRRISWSRTTIFVGPFVLLSLFVGWVFATNFRVERRHMQENLGPFLTLEENFVVVGQTIEHIFQGESQSLIGDSFDQIGDRTTGTISTMALFMTYADEMHSREVALGLNTNIIDTLRLAFIPRFLDPDRPNVSVNLALTNLYMGTEGNRVAISYPVDLYRNFGWLSVFVGMVFVGILYRFYYAWLIEGEIVSSLRLGIYFVIVTTAFTLGNEYGVFFVGSVRTIVGFAIIHVLYIFLVEFLSSKVRTLPTQLYER